MNSKDLIKYGLIAVGVYLIYKAYESGALAQFGLSPATTAKTLPTCANPLTTAQLAAATAAGVVTYSPTTGCPVLTAAQQTAVTALGTPTGAPTKATQTTPLTDPLPPPPPDTRILVYNAAVTALGGSRGDPPMLTTDEWSYYYTQVTGKQAPAGIWPAAPADAIYQANSNQPEVSIDDWWGPMQASGISGLGAVVRYTPAWLM